MTLHQPAHHFRLARRAERRADLLSLLDLYQSIDDVAARHQQAMDLLVNGVDLLAQRLKRGRSGGRLRHLRTLRGYVPSAGNALIRKDDSKMQSKP